MFKIYAHKSGITEIANAKTLAGAKREASDWMSHGGGSVSVLDMDGYVLATRCFWQNGNRFGWDKWDNQNGVAKYANNLYP